MLLTKLGAVPTHPANLQSPAVRRGPARAGVPGGPGGARKPCRRYRLRIRPEPSRRGAAPGADRAGRGSRRRGGLPASPSLGRSWAARPAPLTALPLPAKFRIRFLEPVAPGEPASSGLTESIRALIQENLLEMVAAAQERVAGVALRRWSRRILITGLSSQWGGRLAQVLEHEPGVEAVIGVDTVDPQHELDRTEFVRVDEAGACGGSRGGRDRHRDRHAADRRSAAHLGSGTRHEVNVTGTAGSSRACRAEPPVRKFVFKSSAHYYGCASDDPAFFNEEMTRRRAQPDRRSSATSSRPSRGGRVRGASAAADRHRAARAPRRSGEPAQLAPGAAWPTRRALDPRLRSALPVHPRGRRDRRARHARRHELSGHLQRRRRRRAGAVEVVSLLGKPLLPVLPPWGHGVRRRPSCAGSGSAYRSRCSTSCASVAGSTTAG